MSSKLFTWIRFYPELVVDGNGIICKPCHKAISCTKKHLIDQHCKTAVHRRNTMKMNSGDVVRTSLAVKTEADNGEETFKFDLCKALVSANIPFHKLSNPTFKGFLEKYCNVNIPDESTLRMNTFDACYMDTIATIKSRLLNNFIYFVVNETTDVFGRYIAHLFVGTLSAKSASQPHLIAVKQLANANDVILTRFIQENLTNIFLPNAIPSTKIVLMLTDDVPYMAKGGSHLKVFYPNLIHCTCLTQAVNRIAEEVRLQFSLVNNFIHNMESVFVKAPLRVQVYKEVLPNVPLPPQSVSTRCGTWIDASLFYFKFYVQITEIMSKFDENESAAIKESKRILENAKLREDLTFINNHYQLISDTLTKLERQRISLSESVMLIDNLDEMIKKAQGPAADAISRKLDEVVGKNEGFRILSNVAKGWTVGQYANYIEPHITSCLNYAPITSVDVERIFSIDKYNTSEWRQSFQTENLEKHMIIKVNSNILK